MLRPEEISQRVIDFTSALWHRGQIGRGIALTVARVDGVRKPGDSLGESVRWSGRCDTLTYKDSFLVARSRALRIRLSALSRFAI